VSAPRPLYSVSEFSTPHNTFGEDVEQVARTGGDGIGIWEQKLGAVSGDDASRGLLRDAGLRASACVPAVWSLFPSHLSPQPSRPAERVEAIRESVARLSSFDPACIVVTPGTAADLDPDQADATMLELLAPIVATAEREGATIGLEPIRKSSGGVLHDFRQSLRIREELGSPNVGLVFDVWHLWDEPDILESLAANVDALATVQVNDWREHTRGWTDRGLPGDGIADVAAIVRTLAEAGYAGWYDLEIFSDDGTYVERYPDSLWLRPHEEFLAAARGSFERIWEQATNDAAGGGVTDGR
jgi:sugar phosphate isomerase/epimerase